VVLERSGSAFVVRGGGVFEIKRFPAEAVEPGSDLSHDFDEIVGIRRHGSDPNQGEQHTYKSEQQDEYDQHPRRLGQDSCAHSYAAAARKLPSRSINASCRPAASRSCTMS
jgi:hypothetical protein